MTEKRFRHIRAKVYLIIAELFLLLLIFGLLFWDVVISFFGLIGCIFWGLMSAFTDSEDSIESNYSEHYDCYDDDDD